MMYREIPEAPECKERKKYYFFIGLMKIFISFLKFLWKLPKNIILLCIELLKFVFKIIINIKYIIAYSLIPLMFIIHWVRLKGGQPDFIQNIPAEIYNNFNFKINSDIAFFCIVFAIETAIWFLIIWCNV